MIRKILRNNAVANYFSKYLFSSAKPTFGIIGLDIYFPKTFIKQEELGIYEIFEFHKFINFDTKA